MTSIGDADLWASFGLPGLVIFSLLGIMIYGAILIIKRFDKVDEENRKLTVEMLKSHREERSEWKVSSDKQIDKFEVAITRLADGIRDTRK